MKLKVFEPFTEKLGFRYKEVKIDKPMCVKNLQEFLGIDLGSCFVAVNGTRMATPETVVDDNDELWLLPLVDGG
ncbi:MAG: MoaD/ThiS family protein [Candidatus Bathyarchaeia archaeon]